MLKDCNQRYCRCKVCDFSAESLKRNRVTNLLLELFYCSRSINDVYRLVYRFMRPKNRYQNDLGVYNSSTQCPSSIWHTCTASAEGEKGAFRLRWWLKTVCEGARRSVRIVAWVSTGQHQVGSGHISYLPDQLFSFFLSAVETNKYK